MTREEEREKAAKNRADQYSHMVQWNECYHHFKQGAEWADEHPRTDIIQRDSITFCRMLLVEKFCNIAKNNVNKTIDEVPEMKEAYDVIELFDNACKFAGYEFDEENGVYKKLNN